MTTVVEETVASTAGHEGAGRQGTQGRRHRAAVQHRHRHRLGGPGLQPGRGARLRRARVGLQSPVVMLLAFIPMVFVAIGYQQLNKVMPDCGTTFTWGTKAFGPKTGWMGGWGIIAADVIVMANLAADRRPATCSTLFGAVRAWPRNKWWTLLLGIAWIIAMAPICYIGIEISARFQYGLLAIELVMLGDLQRHGARQGVRRQRRPQARSTRPGRGSTPSTPRFAALTSGMLTPSSSTGVGTRPCRSTRRPRDKTGRRARPRSSRRSCCS